MYPHKGNNDFLAMYCICLLHTKQFIDESYFIGLINFHHWTVELTVHELCLLDLSCIVG